MDAGGLIRQKRALFFPRGLDSSGAQLYLSAMGHGRQKSPPALLPDPVRWEAEIRSAHPGCFSGGCSEAKGGEAFGAIKGPQEAQGCRGVGMEMGPHGSRKAGAASMETLVPRSASSVG